MQVSSLTYLHSGKATVVGLASQGATVYMGARSEAKAEEVIKSLKNEIKNADIRFLYMDLTKFATVVAAAAKIREYVPQLCPSASGPLFNNDLQRATCLTWLD